MYYYIIFNNIIANICEYKKIGSFTNYQSVMLDDIKSNPEKAGSIDDTKE